MPQLKINFVLLNCLLVFLFSCASNDDVLNRGRSSSLDEFFLIHDEPLRGLKLFEGWADARALDAVINTLGWEDSPIISLDGQVLYFGYTALDVDEVWKGNPVVVGPDKAPKRPNHNGVIFDIYEARFKNGKWTVENLSVNSKNSNYSEAAVGVGTNQTQMVFVRWPVEDIYHSFRQANGSWGKAQRLPNPVNSPCNEDNPHLSKDGLTLYFDSTRIDLKGSQCMGQEFRFQRHIWVSHFVGQKWSEPKKLHIEARKDFFFMQPFSRNAGRDLYWTGLCETSNSLCVYHSRRASKGRYVGTTVVLQATGKKDGAGFMKLEKYQSLMMGV